MWSSKRAFYTLAENGVKMEAMKFTSTVTDEDTAWVRRTACLREFVLRARRARASYEWQQ